MRPARRLRRLLLVLTVALLLPLVVLEVVARAYTTVAPNGMPAFRLPGLDCALLPFRPTAATTQEWLERSSGARFIVPDPDLGWTVAPASRAELLDTLDRPLVYESNAQGVRADPERVFAERVPAGMRRIVVVGDSFTFGADLALEQTWTSKLEGLADDLELINLGVQAYGCDQAVLRWEKDGRRFDADLVLLMIWPEDLLRSQNLLRYHVKPRAGFLMAKPRFVLADGELELIQHPTPAPAEIARLLAAPSSMPALRHEHWYDARTSSDSWLYASRLYNVVASLAEARRRQLKRLALYTAEDPSALELAGAIAARFADAVRASGARAAVCILPQQDLLEFFPNRGDFPLVARLEARGIEVVDLFPTFTQTGAPLELFFPSGHFNERGATLVAHALYTAFGHLP